MDSSKYSVKQGLIENDQRITAKASLRGSLSVLLVGAIIGVPIGVALLIANGDTVTITVVALFVLMLSIMFWIDTPFRFPKRVSIDEQGVAFEFRFSRQKIMSWNEIEIIRTGKLGPGRFYKVAEYSAWLYRHGKRLPAIRADIGEVAYRELKPMAERKGIRIVMYPPERI